MYALYPPDEVKADSLRPMIRRHTDEPMLPLGGIQDELEKVDGDVLFLYNRWSHPSQVPLADNTLGAGASASAGTTASAGLGAGANNRRHSYEVLAASSLDDASINAFTRAVADELRTAAGLGPFKVTELFEHVSGRLKLAKPRGRGRPPKDASTKTTDDFQAPNHYWLSRNMRTIVLAPAPPPSSDPEPGRGA